MICDCCDSCIVSITCYLTWFVENENGSIIFLDYFRRLISHESSRFFGDALKSPRKERYVISVIDAYISLGMVSEFSNLE